MAIAAIMVAGRDAGQPGVGVSGLSRENCSMTNFRGRTRCTGLAALLALALLASPLATQAQVDTKMASEKMAATDKKEDAGPWSATLAAGYAKTSGNSESSAANFKGEGRYDKDRWHHILGATAVGTSSAANRDEDSVTTAEAYWAGFQSQYDITEAFYGFGSIDWYKDRFSAYDQQLFETAGIGWRILRGEVHFLDLEVGGGAKQAQLTSGEDQNEGIGVRAWHLHLEYQQERDIRPETGGSVGIRQHLHGNHQRAEGGDHRQSEHGPGLHLPAQLGRGNRHLPGPAAGLRQDGHLHDDFPGIRLLDWPGAGPRDPRTGGVRGRDSGPGLPGV